MAYPHIDPNCYPYRPPKFPLSKRLRPFQERLLYGRIDLRSVDRFHSLYHTLDLDPTRGELVTEIAICSQSRPRNDPSRVSLDDLLSALPNLVTLSLPTGPTQYKAPSRAIMHRLSRVTHVTTRVHDDSFGHDSRFRLSDLACLSALPNLETLEIHGSSTLLNGVNSYPEAFRFSNLETLRFVQTGADADAVVKLVDLCPNLVHFEWSSYLKEPDFPRILPFLPPTLRSLCIETPTIFFDQCDPFLPRFTKLQSLDLTDLCYSFEIHTALAQLPDLTEVRFEGSAVDYRGLASLVSGPSRMVNLKSITLDTRESELDEEPVGNRAPAPSAPSFPPPQGDVTLSLDMSDWPSLRDDLEDPVGLRMLVGACESNGVNLSGTLLDCFEALEDFHIEHNNRAVLAVAFGPDNTFDRIRDARLAASQDGVSVPDFDLDSLDPDHLEVVETELPEKEWFVLSLRNKPKPDE
ncbi:hypothetical protein JCM11491_000034 [Sporobolomyces phaffii]